MKTPSRTTRKSNQSATGRKNLGSEILTIRGQKVILDYTLAELFGCDVNAFRKRIAQILKRRDERVFMFELSKEDLQRIMLDRTELVKQSAKTALEKPPRYAFTEQGVSILTMLLGGEIVIKQNHDLATALRAVEEHLREPKGSIQQQDGSRSMEMLLQATDQIGSINAKLAELERRMDTIESRSDLIASPTDLSLIYANCKDTLEKLGTVFLGSEPMRASKAYMDIYHSAEKTIYILDNYASIKTLWHLDGIKPGVKVIIFSDNLENSLHSVDFVDFKRERPGTDIKLIRTMEKLHDRFIVIDAGKKTEAIYHCGTSEKDAGHKIAAISKLENKEIKNAVRAIVEGMLNNKALKLK